MSKSIMFPAIHEKASPFPCSVVRPWVAALPFKQQTVLLTSLREYDGVAKIDPSKPLVKAMRATLLHNADPTSSGFMRCPISTEFVSTFFEDCHHYPLHWVMHFVHAAEIVAYKHPDAAMREWWLHVYMCAVSALHVNAETELQMDARLKDNVDGSYV